MARKPNIGRAELEVLNYVNDHHPATVREVADHLSRERGIVRTTVLNVMNRLCDKGYLSRRRVEGVFRYSPRVAKGDLMRSLVRDFVERAPTAQRRRSGGPRDRPRVGIRTARAAPPGQGPAGA